MTHANAAISSATLKLDALLAAPLTAVKGLPRRAIGQPLSQLGELGLSILGDELPYPVALLRESALAHNLQWMADFTQRAGISLCPHGKTTMAPQLFDRQLQAGSWGITAATASHVRIYRQFGVQRVLLANQLVDRANIDLVIDELEADATFECFVLVDSIAALSRLKAAAMARGLKRPIDVLLEVGAVGGRTGVRDTEEGLQLGRALRDAAPVLALRGVEAFEGIAGGEDHAAELAVHAMLDTIVQLARTGVDETWFAPGEIILTAGGSSFFDVAAEVLRALPVDRARVVLRSGCYLSHDALHYQRMQARMKQRAGAMWGTGPGLRNAIEVWSIVQSVPERGRAICALGKRDISFDIELPQPLWWFRPGLHDAPQAVAQDLRVTKLNDQHAYIDAESGDMPWQVGDRIGFGIGHPCTTFDKWPLLYVVDDALKVVGGVRTFF